MPPSKRRKVARLGARAIHDNGTAHCWTSEQARAANSKSKKNAKLTVEQVRDIKRRLARGERRVDIARIYGVSDTTIGWIKRGETWKEVEAKG